MVSFQRLLPVHQGANCGWMYSHCVHDVEIHARFKCSLNKDSAKSAENPQEHRVSCGFSLSRNLHSVLLDELAVLLLCPAVAGCAFPGSFLRSLLLRGLPLVLSLLLILGATLSV